MNFDHGLPGKYGETYEKVQRKLARFRKQKADMKLLFEHEWDYLNRIAESFGPRDPTNLLIRNYNIYHNGNGQENQIQCNEYSEENLVSGFEYDESIRQWVKYRDE
jgi:hypothetical protein